MQERPVLLTKIEMELTLREVYIVLNQEFRDDATASVLIDFWYEIFKYYSRDTLHNASLRYAQEKRFIPTPADFMPYVQLICDEQRRKENEAQIRLAIEVQNVSDDYETIMKNLIFRLYLFEFNEKRNSGKARFSDFDLNEPVRRYQRAVHDGLSIETLQAQIDALREQEEKRKPALKIWNEADELQAVESTFQSASEMAKNTFNNVFTTAATN